jgi:hypothetical protein
MDPGVLSGVFLFAAPLALYVFVVGVFTKGVATWTAGILRPLLLMLLFAPGIAAGGHGVAIVPVALVLAYDLSHLRAGSTLGTNLTIWLSCALAAFLFECVLAFWWRRRPGRGLRDPVPPKSG